MIASHCVRPRTLPRDEARHPAGGRSPRNHSATSQASRMRPSFQGGMAQNTAGHAEDFVILSHEMRPYRFWLLRHEDVGGS